METAPIPLSYGVLACQLILQEKILPSSHHWQIPLLFRRPQEPPCMWAEDPSSLMSQEIWMSRQVTVGRENVQSINGNLAA